MREPTGLYTKEVMKYFKRPINMGIIKNPDGVGKVGNPLCGDVMWLYIKVKKDKYGKTRIKDIKFQTYGCVAAISTSSKITELAKGKTIEEALTIDRDDIIKSLGGLPVSKIHCSLLATDALAEAIYDYYTKNKIPIPEKLQKTHERLQKVLEHVEERYEHIEPRNV
jgi:nitrogen fixation NifU-like protein